MTFKLIFIRVSLYIYRVGRNAEIIASIILECFYNYLLC